MTTWACICRFGGIGDNLIASSVLPALKAKYDRVEVITQRPQHVVFENNPYIDKLSVYDSGDIPGYGAEWHAWFARRSKEYALLENLSFTVEGAHAFQMAQSEFHSSAKYRRHRAAGSYITTAALKCDVPLEDCWPGFFPTDNEIDQAWATREEHAADRPVIGWVISGSRLDKIYPYGSVAIARLIRELDVSVMVFGAPGKDFEIAKSMEENIRLQNDNLDHFHIAIGEESWPIRRVLTQAQCCDLVIGPDTGPMWAVAACEMPKIMLLSHASVENITGQGWRNTITLHADPKRVPCWSCHQLHDMLETCVPNDSNSGVACISDIRANCVFTASKAALGCKSSQEKLLKNWASNVTLQESLAWLDTSLGETLYADNAQPARGGIRQSIGPTTPPQEWRGIERGMPPIEKPITPNRDVITLRTGKNVV